MLNRLFTITALSILLSTSLAHAQGAKAGGIKEKAAEGCPAYGSRVETQSQSREISTAELKDKAIKASAEEDKAAEEEGKAGAHKGGDEEVAE